jgi:ectoine hydroxylase-related dioxygenase (phytanoyl-CoA dioxygenase family)
MTDSILTASEQAAYDRDGYFTVRKLFDDEEIAMMREAIESDPALRSSFYDRRDKAGMATRMALWNHPGDSIYGLAARSNRVVERMESMLGGEVYHYHSKLTAKEPAVGGAWEWHQDYGYWYHNGCMFPLMASVMVALDRSNRDNGCLQVVRGSHLLGRIEHGVLEGEQVGADPARVEKILERLPVDYAELEPGDGLFFHSNVLHRSDQNRSPDRRWTVLMCYNAARNDPYLDHHHPRYTPLAKVADEEVRKAGVRLSAGVEAFRQQSANPPELRKRMAENP